MHTSQKQLTHWKHISPHHYYILVKYQANHKDLRKTYQTKCYFHTQIYLILFHIKQIILFDGYTAKTSESLQLSSSVLGFKSKDHSFVNIHVLSLHDQIRFKIHNIYFQQDALVLFIKFKNVKLTNNGTATDLSKMHSL